MKIEDISIEKSLTHERAWILRGEIQGLKFTGYFDDFGGFLTAVQEMGTFFAHRLGKLSHTEAQRHLTRNVAPGSKPS